MHSPTPFNMMNCDEAFFAGNQYYEDRQHSLNHSQVDIDSGFCFLPAEDAELMPSHNICYFPNNTMQACLRSPAPQQHKRARASSAKRQLNMAQSIFEDENYFSMEILPTLPLRAPQLMIPLPIEMTDAGASSTTRIRHPLRKGIPAFPKELAEEKACPYFAAKHLEEVLSRLRSLEQMKPRMKRSYVVHGKLDNKKIVAMPDTGSQLNIVSEAYIKSQNISIDTSDVRKVRIASGRYIRTLGSVVLPWKYQGETKTQMITCHVLRHCSHTLILGNPFLGKGFMKRVKVTREASSKPVSVNLLGSESQRVVGHLEDAPAVALPDMGSDLCLLSSDYAESRDFKVDTSLDKRVEFELPDGSRRYTDGVVEDLTWKFGHGEQTNSATTTFYVVRDLPVDIILSNDLLFDSNAFDEYEESFFYVETKEPFAPNRNILDVFGIRFLGSVGEIFSKQPEHTHKQSKWPTLYCTNVVCLTRTRQTENSPQEATKQFGRLAEAEIINA
jgi:hypothetical protein